MIVRRLQEFIDALSLKIVGLSSKDLEYLQNFKDIYSLTDPETMLTEAELIGLESVFIERWHNVQDTQDDYTFNSGHANSDWISLAKHISVASKKPYLQVLIPVITNDLDPDIFSNLSRIQNLQHFFLGDDDKTLRSVEGLFQKLEMNPGNISTYNSTNELKSRPLTLKELYRIRGKTHLDEILYKTHTRFWDYLITDVAPLWQHNGKLCPTVLSSLLTTIEIYLQENSEGEDYNNAFSEFITSLSSLSFTDLTHFYGVLIEYDGRKIHLLDILMDCLKKDSELPTKLKAVSGWLYQADRALVAKKIQLSSMEQPPPIVKYFAINHLRTLIAELSVKLSPSFACLLEKLEQTIAAEKKIETTVFNQLKSLFSLPWLAVIDSSDKQSLRLAKAYKSFWHYLIRELAPHWRYSGKLPTQLLPELLELIDLYYQSANKAHHANVFNNHLLNFIINISACAIEEANYFYSLAVYYNGEKFYLLELLIEFFQKPDDLSAKINTVARLIYELNPSLITKSTALAPFYKLQQAGPYFDISKLRFLLNQLTLNPISSLKLELANLQENASKTEEITPALIKQIIKLYAKVWDEIIDTEKDYTRVINEKENPWVSLVQHLAGAKLIPANYYKILIPSLSHDDDFITFEPLIYRSLSNYILDDNGKELILLSNCVNHHKTKQTFYKSNHEPMPLTLKEKQRLQYSAKVFVDYFNAVEKKIEDLSVSKKTIKMVQELINGSLHPVGLSLGTEYNNSQMAAAYSAYDKSLKYISELPEKERIILYDQHILFHNTLLTFKDVMEKVQTEEECIAVWGQFFIQLVMDYAPSVRFSKELEFKVDVDTMRLYSAKKVYREYDDISEEEAKRRVLIIYTSLMSHSFKFIPCTGIPLYTWGGSNTVTVTGQKIYKSLEHIIHTGNFEDIRFVYATLIENIVKKALDSEGFITSMTRYNDTRLWLETMENNSLFAPENATFFEPKLLLSRLWLYANKNQDIRPVTELFLEEIVQTMVQNQPDYLKWIRINIKFADFLNKLDDVSQSAILAKLRDNPQAVIHSVFIEKTTEFIIHQLACRAAQVPAKKIIFFNANTSINTIIYNLFCNKFKQELSMLKISDDISIKDLLDILFSVAKQMIGKLEPKWVNSYHEKMTYQDPAFLSDEDYSKGELQTALRF